MEEQEKDKLKDLLIRLVDSRDGYIEAGEAATQDRHKKLFGDLGAQRKEFAEDIRKALSGHGVQYDTDGSFEAGVHRWFMNIKHKLDSENDEELLEEIETGESKLLDKYEEVIKTVKTDTALLEKVQNQYKQVKSNYEVIKAKEEAA